eukprot:1033616-Rhodomonas_salina.1
MALISLWQLRDDGVGLVSCVLYQVFPHPLTDANATSTFFLTQMSQTMMRDPICHRGGGCHTERLIVIRMRMRWRR